MKNRNVAKSGRKWRKRCRNKGWIWSVQNVIPSVSLANHYGVFAWLYQDEGRSRGGEYFWCFYTKAVKGN